MALFLQSNNPLSGFGALKFSGLILLVSLTSGCQAPIGDQSAGLKGIDGDRNGIRDDIDAMITTKYSGTPAQRDVAKRLARTMQVLLESQTPQEASMNYQPVSKALGCMFLRLKGNDSSKMYAMLRDIEAILKNTRERFRHYWNVNKMISRSTLSITPNETCDESFDAG